MAQRKNRVPDIVKRNDTANVPESQAWERGYDPDGRHVSEMTVDELDQQIERVKNWLHVEKLGHKQTTILQHALAELKARDIPYHLEVDAQFQKMAYNIVSMFAPFLSTENNKKVRDEMEEHAMQKVAEGIRELEEAVKR